MNGDPDELGRMRILPALCVHRHAGSVLLALLFALLILAVLASVIIPLVSNSGQQSIASNLASKAYLLAESGFRYALSQYRHSGPTQSDRNDILEALGGNYTLDNGQGSFNITVNSFYYEITADANGTDPTIISRSPGTFPFNEIDLNSGLRLSIDNTIYDIQGFTKSGDSEDGNVTFTINPLGNSIAAGSIALPAVESSSSSQTLSNGGTLQYEAGGGGMFPLQNGHLHVGYRNLSYHYNDRANNQFIDVRDPTDPAMNNYLVPAGTPITLDLYARLRSTGVAGSGSLETRREVIYHDVLPQDTDSSARREFGDSFESQLTTAANWITDSGSHEVGTVDTVDGGSNQALKVTAAPQGRSLITLRVATVQDLFNAARRSTGGYLSYDIQTKVGYYSNSADLPSAYFPGAPVPAYVAAGLSFRLSPAGSLYNGYGLSFMRAGSPEDPPLNIAPVQDRRIIVLWQQVNNGQDYQWLAYKDISGEALLETGFEDGWEESDWTSESTSSEVRWRRAANRPYSGSYAFAYNSESTLTYDTGTEPNAGTLTYMGPDGKGISLPGAQRIDLNFRSWYHTELLRDADSKQVRIRTRKNNDPMEWNGWEDLVSIKPQPPPSDSYPERTWTPVQIPLAAYAGQTVQFQFSFDTGDASLNTFEGWYVDDVTLTWAWPIEEATLVVRLKEAALLEFAAGQNSPIKQGDRVYGRESGTLGTVIVPPILRSGDWINTPAEGVLLLNKVTSSTNFSANEDLRVIDSNATAQVSSFDNNVDRKVNVIKVYYASPAGYETGTIVKSPLDADTLGYHRLETDQALQWPVAEGGNWTADRDYFRLIQWDKVNDANVTNLDVIPSLEEPGAILRHYNDELKSPGMDTTLNQPELGLHSYGDGAANVYFDDFGVQLYIRQDFTFPLQQ